ncbi:MAG: ATP-binding protein [Elusimicrobia bacterium]|nr:ATP-binding protein [Elusimicrobiota bacterium]
MREIPKEQIIRRIQAENIWWGLKHQINDTFYGMRRRAYFKLFMPLVEKLNVKRAVVLMGPRRVGKTVMIHQAVQQLIETGIDPRQICYISVDAPLFNECGLDDFIELFESASGADLKSKQAFLFLDEIQYLRNWETQLKNLVDTKPNIRFVASGSAAAALRLKSLESGAGRFTEFLLPPLTFHEYLDLLEKNVLVKHNEETDWFETNDINNLNSEFMSYLNFGGYPEAIFSEAIRADPARFIKSDIVDKVLLRDLPGLYGIQDIQELNYLFTTLAFNTANEVSLEGLAEKSGVAKNTIKRYIDYLEAAFLIKVVHKISHNARRFQRATSFKVYLTNPSIRSALFSAIEIDDPAMGYLAETGIFSQWFHNTSDVLYYARWKDGEVDIVSLDHKQKPRWAVEVKWSDRCVDNLSDLKNVLNFCKWNKLSEIAVTTRTATVFKHVDQLRIKFIPTALYCYTVGHNLVNRLQQ